MIECDLRCGENKDLCSKYKVSGMKCKPYTISDFEETFEHCDMEQVCRKGSIYGNQRVIITDEDIEALKSGKVLCLIDEYGTFIAYKKEE